MRKSLRWVLPLLFPTLVFAQSSAQIEANKGVLKLAPTVQLPSPCRQGQLWFDSTTTSPKSCNDGTNWTAIGGGGTTFSADVLASATYCVDAVGTDAYACNFSPAPASLAAMTGAVVTFKAATVNTGAATFAPNGFAATAIVKVGQTTTTALVTNDIRAGSFVTVSYDGTSFVCLSCDGNRAGLTAANSWTGAQTFQSTVNMNPAQLLIMGGGAGDGIIYPSTTNTPDAPALLTGSTSNLWQAYERADVGFDYQAACTTGLGTVACTDPTFIIHSHNQSTTEALSFAHNGANGVIYSGLGPVALAGVSSAVASATALPLPTGNIFHVSGTTNITSITSTGLSKGITITLIFDGVLTFTDGSNLFLAGNFVTTADDTITLAFDGTNFYEIARSIN